jgi:hypothetical protein
MYSIEPGECGQDQGLRESLMCDCKMSVFVWISLAAERSRWTDLEAMVNGASPVVSTHA